MSAPNRSSFGKAWATEYFAEVDRMNPDGCAGMPTTPRSASPAIRSFTARPKSPRP